MWRDVINTVRGLASLPLAIVTSFLAYFATNDITPWGTYYAPNSGIVHLVGGLTPLLIKTVVPTAVFVMTGAFVWPRRSRRVAFVFFGLSFLLSGSGTQLIILQEFSCQMWTVALVGIGMGAICGLGLTLGLQKLLASRTVRTVSE